MPTNFKTKEMQNILKKNGYEKKRQRGSHEVWYNDMKNDTVVITNRGKGVNYFTGSKMMKDHGIVIE